MTRPLEPRPESPPESQLQEIQASLRKLERRDWWLWLMAVVVMLLLTLAVVSLNFPDLLRFEEAFFQFSLNQAVRGLVGLVLLFNTYTIYQQAIIKRLRRQFCKQLDAMSRLQIRAEKFHKQATRDALTGLYNRSFGEQRLEAEASRSRRYGHPLTVMALDQNNFKRINDRYGHPVGDRVLKEFAVRPNNTIRVSDLASRMGGDEFLLLPECPAEQVRTTLARLGSFELECKGERIPISCSEGCIGYERGETREQFRERADQTLYANKRAQGPRPAGSPRGTLKARQPRQLKREVKTWRPSPPGVGWGVAGQNSFCAPSPGQHHLTCA